MIGSLLCTSTTLRYRSFDVIRKELAMKSEVASKQFPLLQPYRGDYHPWKSHPKGGPIPEDFGTVLLQSGEHNKGGDHVKKRNFLKTVRRNFEGWTKREVEEVKLARTVQSRVGNM